MVLFNASVLADDFYIGTGLAFNNSIGLEHKGTHIDENSDIGFSVFSGYSFMIASTFELGFELEYQNFGKAEFVDGVSVEGDAYFINAKPKFIETNNNLYSAFILGVGSLSGKLDLYSDSFTDSEMAYQVGVEVGYMVNQWEIGVEYRYLATEFDTVEFTSQGFVVGTRYKF